MKSKKAMECTLILCDVKIVLPRVVVATSTPKPKTSFKPKKKYKRISGSSDKENDSRSVIYSQPNLSLNQIGKMLNNVVVDRIRDTKKTKKKGSDSEDSGISMKLPRTRMRKHSKVLGCSPIDVPETASSTTSNREICDLEDIIQSHSSHNCNDKIDHKMNNVESIRTSTGLFVRKDFVIRIQQLCIDQPSENSTPERTTSIVASATRSENVEKSGRKVRQNVAVEKKIGINTRVKVGNREKNCTSIVESKFVQTTERNRKKIKLHEPSPIVTRRRAAANTECEFYTLSNKKDGGIIVTPNVSKNLKNQPDLKKVNGSNQLDKLMRSSKNIFSKGRKHSETMGKRREKNEPKPSCSKSFLSCEDKKNAENFESSVINLNKKPKFNRTLKNVTLYRHQSSESSITSQLIHKVECYVEVKSSRTRKRTAQEAEIDADTVQLRKSTRIKRFLSDKENAPNNKNDYSSEKEPTRKNVKQLNDSSAANFTSHQSCNRVNGLKPPAKPKDNKPSQQMKIDEIESPKKRAKVPAKKLMNKNEALKKTEKFNKKKKALSKSDVKVPSKTTSPSLELAVLPRRVTRFSSKTENNSLIGNTSKLESVKGTPGVKFSSKTPETIPRRGNDSESDWDPNFTPRILLDRLDTTNISSYAITPLREERGPLPSKSFEDYGIDDVNTDDSTDEEDNPKKTVPLWAKSLGHKPEVQFYFPRDVIKEWIRPPKRRFTVKGLFF